MAFGSVGSLGTGTSNASSSSLVVTTSATLEVGNLCVLTIAKDNSSTTDGDNGEVTGVSDDAGNVWTKIAEQTNGNGAAATGATVSHWFTVATVQLNSGANITVSFVSNITAKAASAWEYTIASGGTVSVETFTPTVADASQIGSSTLSGLAAQEYLFFRACAAEQGSLDLLVTLTSGYSQITVARTGVTTSGMQATAEFRIFTGTGDTSNPVCQTTDNATIYAALKEIAAAQPNVDRIGRLSSVKSVSALWSPARLN